MLPHQILPLICGLLILFNPLHRPLGPLILATQFFRAKSKASLSSSSSSVKNTSCSVRIMNGDGAYNPRTVEEVFRDYNGRRNGMIKALTTGKTLVSSTLTFPLFCLFFVSSVFSIFLFGFLADVHEFHRLCDPGECSLHRFDLRRWKVTFFFKYWIVFVVVCFDGFSSMFFSKVLIFIWLDSIETKKVCIFLWFHDLGYLQFVLGWALWL